MKRILDKIESLSDNPHPQGSIKLTNQEKYRVRFGKYRILYNIKDNILPKICKTSLRVKKLAEMSAEKNQ